MRKLAGLRTRTGVPIDGQRWAEAIARLLTYWDEGICTKDVQFRMERVGLRRPDTDIAQRIVEWALRLKHNGHLFTPKELGQEIGRLLELTDAERDTICFWSAEAINETNAEARERRRRERAALRHRKRDEKAEQAARAKRREADRKRKQAERRAAGSVSRETYETGSATRTQPWIAAGMSRRTWYRRMKPEPVGTSPSAGTSASEEDQLGESELVATKKDVSDGSRDLDVGPTKPTTATLSREREASKPHAHERVEDVSEETIGRVERRREFFRELTPPEPVCIVPASLTFNGILYKAA